MASKLLVVDDEPQICQALQLTLARAGYEVHCFFSAEACLLTPNTASADLLITDINMPEINGIQLIKKVREQNIFIPIIAMTGYGDIQTAVTAIKAGATEFVEKPFKDDDFLELIHSILESAKATVGGAEGQLTEVEKLVLHHVAMGMSNKQIAHALDRSIRTIENHRQRISKKLGTESLAEMVKVALKLGLGGDLYPREE